MPGSSGSACRRESSRASTGRFLLPNVGIAAIVGALALRYFHVAHEWRRSVELEARSRIRALQARIRPHFLFNSMNTIASLTRSDPARAEEAIEDLSDLFRVSLSEARAQITLREELEVARIYQRIEQLRLGDRLQVRWKVADLPAEAIVPSLLLQPLLENAIGHGIEPLPEGGTVTIEGHAEGGDRDHRGLEPGVGHGARGARRQSHGARQHPPAARSRLPGPGLRRSR